MPQSEHTDSELQALRHTTSHILAQAVKRLYPGVKFAIGPAIADGFYYDFDFTSPISDSDLPKIETEMKKIVKEKLELVRSEINKSDAEKLFQGEVYKLELIEQIKDDLLTIYTQGDFSDLCAGPHVETTGKSHYFKLLSIAGAYWRGSEDNKMLTRVYGTVFPTKEALKEHLERLEEAKKRDHRKLGTELDLFTIDDDFGAGLPLWLPKGAMLRKVIEDFWKDLHVSKGYDLLTTPHIAKLDLWDTSGHTSFYSENMYSPMAVEEQKYIAKPMNCPGHILVYRSRLRSYRELPIRYAELGTVYRYERSGVLHGLLRVRGFTQDDAHIFCQPDQVESEILNVLEIVRFILSSFGFDQYEIFVSTRPEKSVGTDEHWDIATKALEAALDKAGMKYSVDPGEGVFYGPKIDIKIKDALGRMWQCSTIQVDFNLPERFEIKYIDSQSTEVQPIMIHRAILGSMERFIGCLIEHYGGAFPVWVAPVQAMVIPIADRHIEYAMVVQKAFTEVGGRVEIDARSESMGKKVRMAIKQKIPMLLIVGDSEEETSSVSLRRYGREEQSVVSLSELVGEFEVAVREKSPNY